MWKAKWNPSKLYEIVWTWYTNVFHLSTRLCRLSCHFSPRVYMSVHFCLVFACNRQVQQSSSFKLFQKDLLYCQLRLDYSTLFPLTDMYITENYLWERTIYWYYQKLSFDCYSLLWCIILWNSSIVRPLEPTKANQHKSVMSNYNYFFPFSFPFPSLFFFFFSSWLQSKSNWLEISLGQWEWEGKCSLLSSNTCYQTVIRCPYCLLLMFARFRCKQESHK